MNVLEIAELKDNILKYLSADPKIRKLMHEIYRDLKLENIQVEIIVAYMNDMVQDEVIESVDMSQNRNLYWINERGLRLLSEGGYTERIKLQLKVEEQKIDDDMEYREKTKLEIKDLKDRSKHYKRIETLSIIALIFSALSVLFSIIYNLFIAK